MADLTPNDHEKLQIDIFLNEYQACHQTRNHYDSVRWTIGSIFIGASLALFGLSLDKPLVAVLLAFFFSFFLIIVWYLYAHHVNPYVMASIIRSHEIEKALRNMKFRIELHNSIHRTDDEILNLKGTIITFALFSLVIVIWFFRIALSVYDFFKGFNRHFLFWACILILVYALFLIVFWGLHEKFNPINLGERIKEILEDC